MSKYEFDNLSAEDRVGMAGIITEKLLNLQKLTQREKSYVRYAVDIELKTHLRTRDLNKR